jgi:hypothetical protein
LRRLSVEQAETLGANHRESLDTSQLLVWVLGLQGKIAEAEQECRRLLDGCHARHGADHPDTLQARYREALLSALAGKPEQARRQFGVLVDDYRRAVDPSHPHLLQARLGYAWSLRLTGDARAERTHRDLLRDVESILGPRAVLTLRTRDALGLVLLRAGRLAEAETLFRALRRETGECLAVEHRDHLLAVEHLARTWHRLGRVDEAQWEFKRVVRARARFDSSHVDVRRAARDEHFTRLSGRRC